MYSIAFNNKLRAVAVMKAQSYLFPGIASGYLSYKRDLYLRIYGVFVYTCPELLNLNILNRHLNYIG